MASKQAESLSLTSLTLLTERLLREASLFPGIQAYKPHASQEKFHKAIHKEKLYIGGNRSGKTVGNVTEQVFWLTGEHPYRTDLPPPPIRGRCVAVDIEDGIKKMILPELAKWTPRSYWINDSWEDSYDRQSRTLTLNNGSFVELMSYEQDEEKFAGTSRHYVAFDEEPPENIFNECLARLVDTDGSYWISMTPLVDLTWIKERIYDPWTVGDTSYFVLEVDVSDNPYVKGEAVERLYRGLSKEERETRKTGAFIVRTGLVYAGSFTNRDYRQGGNIVPDILGPSFRNYTKSWGHFTCMDHGLRNPTVFLFCCFNSNGTIIVYDELYSEGRIVKENAELYLNRLEALGVHPVYCIGDPSIQNKNPVTGTSVQTEYMEHGVPIALGNNNLDAGLVRMQNRFAKKVLFISERCTETHKEITNGYRWDKFASSKIAARRNNKDKPMPKNNHCCDALRYGVMSRPQYDEDEKETYGNILNAAVAGPEEIDWEAISANPEEVFDDVLGIDW